MTLQPRIPLFMPPKTTIFFYFLKLIHVAHYARRMSLICALGALLFLTACSGGNRSDLETLPVDNYLKKPGDFLGNRYVVRAQIDEQLKWEKGLGRVLAVLPEGSDVRLPVFVPDSLSDNLHVGQRYEMQAIIEQGGLIYVEVLHKY